MPAEIRKTLLHVEETLIEGGKPAETPLKMIAAVAVIKNPWAGQGFVEDLRPAIHDCAPGLGEKLTAMILEAAGGGDQVEGYGKSAIVGVNGEVEHGALWHVPGGYAMREALGNDNTAPGLPFAIGFSAGLAQSASMNSREDFEGLLRSVDKALYRAKRVRGRVEVVEAVDL